MAEWKELGRELSPIYHSTAKRPPTFIVHGDADTLVPLDQSRRFMKEAEKYDMKLRLDVEPGGGHGWPTMMLDIVSFARWFDEHLLAGDGPH
jgi:dipeptidyl aminopeptidase/acylaminoacyl peptidase